MGRDITFTTIDEYISQYPPEIGARLQALRDTIRTAAPKATELISWSMPTFYLNGNLVHFAAFKKHIGFFPGADGIEAFKEQMHEYSVSKGGVQFPFDRPLPLGLITEIVRFRIGQTEMLNPKKMKTKKKADRDAEDSGPTIDDV